MMPVTNVHSNTVNDVYYRVYGNKTGKGIVLIHGFPEDGSLWDNIIPLLSPLFRVIIPDVPGSGKSRLNKTDVSIEELADSINIIIEAERFEEIIIAGHSMGGYIALAFADKYPEKLKGLSLVHSTAIADNEEKKETRRKSIDIIQKGGKEYFVKGMIPNLFSQCFRDAHPDIIQQQISRGLKLESKSMVAFYNAMINRPDRVNTLTDAIFPVQWIIGREDKVVPLDSALQQSFKSDVNFVSLYNDSGHMSMLEAPSRLAEDLNNFIEYCYNR